MRYGTLLLGVMFLAVACSTQSNRVASASPSPAVAVSPTASPTPVPIASSYGLLISGATLEMITPDGLLGPSAPIAAATVQSCAPGLNAMLQPPVSASADRVYFRDGDTNIRYIMPSGLKGDATTVPGGATTVSFFSVSPDDSRIAVVVEDFAAAGSIALRLYVEDLNGGGHHADIYSTTIFADAGGQTLWPMGWHQGQLVLALITACSNEPADVAPTEWHVADASTGKRLATIKGSCGVLSDWPSPSGVACLDHALWGTTVFNWAGKLTATTVANSYNSGVALRQTGLSPSGQRIFWATESFGTCDHSCLPYHTDINVIFRQGYQRFATQHDWPPACLWIDEAHLLGPNTVLTVSLVNGSATIAATELANRGQCAGRYPGGL